MVPGGNLVPAHFPQAQVSVAEDVKTQEFTLSLGRGNAG